MPLGMKREKQNKKDKKFKKLKKIGKSFIPLTYKVNHSQGHLCKNFIRRTKAAQHFLSTFIFEQNTRNLRNVLCIKSIALILKWN